MYNLPTALLRATGGGVAIQEEVFIMTLSITMKCEKCAEDTRLKHDDVNISIAFDIGVKQRCRTCKKMYKELYEVTIFNKKIESDEDLVYEY